MRSTLARGLGSASALAVVLTAAAAWASARQDVPGELAPFEPLIGGWKGTAVPPANKLKGWQEKHAWAWKFAGGRPVGLTFALEGNKQLAKGQLTYDADKALYRLDGQDADGKPVRLAGKFDDASRVLILKKDPEKPGDEQIALKVFDDRPRYLFYVDRREKGATRTTRLVDVGLTKEGESLGRSDAASQPKCIITGGAATLNVTYQGKSYPLCCTGCRDEFQENPEKYVAKAAKLGQATAEPAADPPPTGKAEAPDPDVKAASLLRQAQTFEKAKRPVKALEFYRQVFKDHPGTPQAKAAEEKIKTLEGSKP